MKYLKMLDGIRAIAVLMVVVSHWIREDNPVHIFGTGAFGVQVFFVLSGFLITRILLVSRGGRAVSRNPQEKKHMLYSFYVRRALRIFPVYYLVLLVMLLLRSPLHLPLTKGEVVSALTYTSNFHFADTRHWTALTAHFWSLAVEEQFYLVWPLLILFLPKRSLLPCMLLFVLIGAVSQAFLHYDPYSLVLPNACFDSLGAGALLAWLVTYRPALLPTVYTVASAAALVGLATLAAHWANWLTLPGTRWPQVLIGLWLVLCALVKTKAAPVVVRIFETRALVFVGKISYGIYAYHNLYGLLARRAWDRWITPHLTGMNVQLQSWLFFFVAVWGLFFLCWLSFRWVEKPLLKLKDRFDYKNENVGFAAARVPSVRPESVRNG